MAPKTIDLTGRIFGKLKVLRFVYREDNESYWECLCECGKRNVVRKGNLVQGHSTSCGCYGRARAIEATKTHGMTNSRTYKSWDQMRQRCHNSKHHAFHNYGGRGIGICKEWDDFLVFLRDMGERPEGRSLDRVDNLRGYSPDNCKWSTSKEQNSNTRRTRVITYNNESLSLSGWASRLGTKCATINARIRNGWKLEDAITQPIKEYTRR